MAKDTTRVFVFPIKGREADVAKLIQSISKAGCEVICQNAKPADYEKCLKAANVLVILICSETMNDATLDKLVALASRDGKRVVGVWLPGANTPEIPAALDRHGDAVITLDVESIRKSICGSTPTWTTPDGGPRPTPKTPRHKG